MQHRRFSLIACIAGAALALAASTSAFAASARATVDRGWYGALDALEPVALFVAGLIAVAFPPATRTIVDRPAHTTVRTLGGPQTRSFRSRWLARQTDGRERAPLAAAFVPA